MTLLILALACGPRPSATPALDVPTGRTIDELWTDPPATGVTLTLREAVVVSGLTLDGLSSYVQSADSTRGMEIRLGGPVDGWPPALGTRVDLVVVYEAIGEAPRGWLSSRDAITVTGSAEVRTEPFAGSAPAAFTLAAWESLTITSVADPTGRATTDGGFALDGRFGVPAPSRGSVGRLLGVVTEGGAVAMRAESDFDGQPGALPTVETSIARVLDGAHAEGDFVRFEAVQATPWSRGGRLAVLQDADGRGLWVDTEGFGSATTVAGDRAVWEGELRESAGTWRLRTWQPPRGKGSAEVVVSAEDLHGALIERRFEEVGELDRFGDRPVADGVLDDRFMALDTVGDDVVVVAVDRSSTPARYAVVP